MFVDPHTIFYIRGMPVSWSQIANHWATLMGQNPNKAEKFGDPQSNENSCWRLATDFLTPYVQRIGQKPLTKADWQTTKVVHPNIPPPKILQEEEINWRNQSEVFKKAWKSVEKKHSEDRKNYQKSSSQKKSPYKAPIEVPLDWRKVLEISNDNHITEDIIKRAFRKKALLFHPDKGGSEAKMKELLKARDLAYYFIGKEPP